MDDVGRHGYKPRRNKKPRAHRRAPHPELPVFWGERQFPNRHQMAIALDADLDRLYEAFAKGKRTFHGQRIGYLDPAAEEARQERGDAERRREVDLDDSLYELQEGRTMAVDGFAEVVFNPPFAREPLVGIAGRVRGAQVFVHTRTCEGFSVRVLDGDMRPVAQAAVKWVAALPEIGDLDG